MCYYLFIVILLMFLFRKLFWIASDEVYLVLVPSSEMIGNQLGPDTDVRVVVAANLYHSLRQQGKLVALAPSGGVCQDGQTIPAKVVMGKMLVGLYGAKPDSVYVLPRVGAHDTYENIKEFDQVCQIGADASGGCIRVVVSQPLHVIRLALAMFLMTGHIPYMIPVWRPIEAKWLLELPLILYHLLDWTGWGPIAKWNNRRRAQFEPTSTKA